MTAKALLRAPVEQHVADLRDPSLLVESSFRLRLADTRVAFANADIAPAQRQHFARAHPREESELKIGCIGRQVAGVGFIQVADDRFGLFATERFHRRLLVFHVSQFDGRVTIDEFIGECHFKNAAQRDQCIVPCFVGGPLHSADGRPQLTVGNGVERPSREFRHPIMIQERFVGVARIGADLDGIEPALRIIAEEILRKDLCFRYFVRKIRLEVVVREIVVADADDCFTSNISGPLDVFISDGDRQ